MSRPDPIAEHEGACQPACCKRKYGNFARCYIHLCTENRRLREALQKIVNMGTGVPDPTAETDIARAALNGSRMMYGERSGQAAGWLFLIVVVAFIVLLIAFVKAHIW